jgi:hypothetical protein
MDPSFLFFLSIVLLVVLATTNDILFWSDAEGLLRKKKKRRMKQLKPVAAPVIREADLIGPEGRGASGRGNSEAPAQALQDK